MDWYFRDFTFVFAQMLFLALKFTISVHIFNKMDGAQSLHTAKDRARKGRPNVDEDSI